MWRHENNFRLLLLYCSLVAAASLRAPSTSLHSRRAVISSAAAAATVASSPLSALAAEAVKAQDAKVFVGSYTDPMHPGGTRTITLQDTKLGPFQLAKITGGGGTGEPASFELPAMISPSPRGGDSWQITIDFSPKGGPKDFTGYWDADGIRFPPTPRQVTPQAACLGLDAAVDGALLHCCTGGAWKPRGQQVAKGELIESSPRQPHCMPPSMASRLT